MSINTGGFGPLVFRTTDEVTHFYQYYSAMPDMGDVRQNLCFVEDREVKEGVDEWYIDDFLNKPRSSGGAQYAHKQKVVVATTCPELIKIGIPAIPEKFVRYYCYENADVGYVDIEMDSIYVEPHPSMHSNRGYFKEIPKLKKNDIGEMEVVIYHEPAPVVDWNKFTITQFIEHLEKEFQFSSTGTAKAVFELIRINKEMKHAILQIHTQIKRDNNSNIVGVTEIDVEVIESICNKILEDERR